MKKREREEKEKKLVEGQDKVENSFKGFYMEELTDKYGDDLDEFRKTEADFDETKVSILMNCLENGINVFDRLEKKLILNSKK